VLSGSVAMTFVYMVQEYFASSSTAGMGNCMHKLSERLTGWARQQDINGFTRVAMKNEDEEQ
jgi:hypothetical protein